MTPYGLIKKNLMTPYGKLQGKVSSYCSIQSFKLTTFDRMWKITDLYIKKKKKKGGMGAFA